MCLLEACEMHPPEIARFLVMLVEAGGWNLEVLARFHACRCRFQSNLLRYMTHCLYVVLVKPSLSNSLVVEPLVIVEGSEQEGMAK